jgi:trimethylamine--corrinoid protein Co-methyltransferase
VGPGGHFLQQQHTLDPFREELWRPDVLTRQHYTKWEKDGAQNVYQRIQDKLKKILENHKIPYLSDKTLASLQNINRRGEDDLTDR